MEKNLLFNFIQIQINQKSNEKILGYEYINLPYFHNDMYKGMKTDKEYTLKELDL